MNMRLASVALAWLVVAACSGEGAESTSSASGASTSGGGEPGSGGGTGSSGTDGGGGTSVGNGGAPGTGGGGAAQGGWGSGAGSPADAGPDGSNFDCEVEGIPGNCLDTSDCKLKAGHASTPGFCPGPAEIQCCTPYGTALCDPLDVPDPNAGNTIEAPGQGGCPAGMIDVATFCIDKYEATLVRVDDGSSWSPFFNPGNVAMIAISVAGAVPQGYINGDQADDACTNAGKRLCTDTEWQRACRGPTSTTYPYGNTKQLDVCNDHRSVHPAVEYFGTSDSWIYSHIDNPCLNQLPQSVDPTGDRVGCETAEGALDMMGNLHEWTADPNGTFRGGYYVDTVINGAGCLYATTAHNTLHWDYSTGFRCCAD